MAREENEFLRTCGFAEYAASYLGINEEPPEDTKGRREFPFGDFEKSPSLPLTPRRSRLLQSCLYDEGFPAGLVLAPAGLGAKAFTEMKSVTPS
jgi:hypothetical protein